LQAREKEHSLTDSGTYINNIPSTPEKRSEKVLRKVMRVVDERVKKMNQKQFDAAKEKVKRIAARVSR
jgi:predicted translin family RNA/ssDNA-binding protein